MPLNLQSNGFRDTSESMYTMVMMMFGDFDWNDIAGKDPYVGGILFVSFSFVGVFFAFSMLLKMLDVAYEEVQIEIATHEVSFCP